MLRGFVNLWMSYNPFLWGAVHPKRSMKRKKKNKTKHGDAALFILAWCLSTLMTFVWRNTQFWVAPKGSWESKPEYTTVTIYCMSISVKLWSFSSRNILFMILCQSSLFKSSDLVVCEVIDLSPCDSLVRYITPDTGSSVWSEWRNIYIYLSS